MSSVLDSVHAYCSSADGTNIEELFENVSEMIADYMCEAVRTEDATRSIDACVHALLSMLDARAPQPDGAARVQRMRDAAADAVALLRVTDVDGLCAPLLRALAAPSEGTHDEVCTRRAEQRAQLVLLARGTVEAHGRCSSASYWTPWCDSATYTIDTLEFDWNSNIPHEQFLSRAHELHSVAEQVLVRADASTDERAHQLARVHALVQRAIVDACGGERRVHLSRIEDQLDLLADLRLRDEMAKGVPHAGAPAAAALIDARIEQARALIDCGVVVYSAARATRRTANTALLRAASEAASARAALAAAAAAAAAADPEVRAATERGDKRAATYASLSEAVTEIVLAVRSPELYPRYAYEHTFERIDTLRSALLACTSVVLRPAIERRIADIDRALAPAVDRYENYLADCLSP